MRYIITSDIHGCYAAMDALLEKTDLQPDDVLILAGDLIDRGSNSYEVYRDARELYERKEPETIIIRGNHEQMMIDVHASAVGSLGQRWTSSRMWFSNGGEETERSFRKVRASLSNAAFFFKYKSVYYYETENFIVVHADPRSLENPHACMWDTWSMDHNDYQGKLAFVGHSPKKEPLYLDGVGGPGKALPYGEWLDLPDTGIICIDTGGVFGGAYTAVIVDKRKMKLVKWKA